LGLGIFVEVGAECGGGGGGVGGIGRGLIKAEISKGVGVVSKGASSSELTGRAEGTQDLSIG
jgi:hypothetical protein